MTPGRGAEQLNVVLTQTGGVTKTVIYIYTQYIYMYFARGMFQKHFEQRLTLIQPPDKVAKNYILIYRGGQKLHLLPAQRVEGGVAVGGGQGWQHMHKHQRVSAGSGCLAPARKQHAGSRAV